jgi:hypothetical protein
MALPVQTWVVSLLSIVGVRWLIELAQSKKAGIREGVRVYAPTFEVRAILGLLTPLSAAVCLLLILQHSSWSLVALSVCFALLGILAWPGTIYVSKDCVRSKRWLWGTKVIHWADVTRVTFRRSGLITEVTSRSGEKIAHSAFQVDSQGFREQVKRLSAVDRIENI